MPAPRRAILADINDFNLDPEVPYTKVSKLGNLVSKEQKEKVAMTQPVFASTKSQTNVEDKKEVKKELNQKIKHEVEEQKIEPEVKSSSLELEEKVEKKDQVVLNLQSEQKQESLEKTFKKKKKSDDVISK